MVRQDAVYSCTPAVVPFLADVVADDGAEPAVRAEVALMLAQIAANGVPSDAPDLAGRARSAVAEEFPRLLHPLARGPAAVRAALVAVCATVPGLPARAVVLLEELTGSPDRELADAARVALLLAGDRISRATLDALTDPGFPDEREPRGAGGRLRPGPLPAGGGPGPAGQPGSGALTGLTVLTAATGTGP